MGESLPTNGVIIHAREDWPCGFCRPEAWGGRAAALLLCVRCATAISAASIRTLEVEGLGLLDDVAARAPAQFEPEGGQSVHACRRPGVRGPKTR